MKPTFRLTYIYRKRTYVVPVYLWDVHPNTFENWGNGRWGCFIPTPDLDMFGELHFVKSRLRFDLVDHELFHVFVETIWSHGETITRRNEESMADFKDYLTRIFLRELRKAEPKIKL